jgi:hypothetical protein
VHPALSRPNLLLVKVEDPSGQTWRITRRWVPWRRRLKSRLGEAADMMPAGLGDDPVSAVIFLVCLVIAIPFLVLTLIAGLEVLLVLLVLPFALVGRAAFGRHWIVEARRGFTIWWDEPSGDWQASLLKIHDVSEAIRIGDLPPRTVDVPTD